MVAYIVRVTLRALFIILIDTSANFKATLQYLSAFFVVVLFFVQCYRDLTDGKIRKSVNKHRVSCTKRRVCLLSAHRIDTKCAITKNESPLRIAQRLHS